MKTDQIIICVVALLFGMLLANMLKNIWECKVVEGNVDVVKKNAKVILKHLSDTHSEEEIENKFILLYSKYYGQKITREEIPQAILDLQKLHPELTEIHHTVAHEMINEQTDGTIIEGWFHETQLGTMIAVGIIMTVSVLAIPATGGVSLAVGTSASGVIIATDALNTPLGSFCTKAQLIQQDRFDSGDCSNPPPCWNERPDCI